MRLRRISICRIFLLALLCLLLRQTASAQMEALPKAPQLKLEIIPAKKTYRVGETVFVRYKLTSLADGTILFSDANPRVYAARHWIPKHGRHSARERR